MPNEAGRLSRSYLRAVPVGHNGLNTVRQE